MSLSPVCLPLTLFLPVSFLSGSLAIRALVTKALNSDLPFLLSSKIFIRTIRSSDKESTEGRATERAGCASRMSVGLSVCLSVSPATLPTRTADPVLMSPRCSSPLAFAPAVTAVARCQPAPTPPPLSVPAGSALPSPLGCRGVGHSAGSQGQAGCCTAAHESKVSLSAAQPTRSAGAQPRTSAHGPPLLTIFNRTNRRFLQVEQT